MRVLCVDSVDELQGVKGTIAQLQIEFGNIQQQIVNAERKLEEVIVLCGC